MRKGLKKPRRHLGNSDNYTWDKEACLQEVSSYTNGHSINFAELARKYNLKNGKGQLPNNS